jgi:hypothetical protein
MIRNPVSTHSGVSLTEHHMTALARLAFITAMAAGTAGCADLGGPAYGPAPAGAMPAQGYYQPAPPVYYQAPPTYYAPPAPAYYPPPAAYYPPPPQYRQEPSKPRLSDMQRRALDNCSLLALKDQRECRARVMSTVRR